MFLPQAAFIFKKNFKIYISEFVICYLPQNIDFVCDASAWLNKYVTDSERKLMCRKENFP